MNSYDIEYYKSNYTKSELTQLLIKAQQTVERNELFMTPQEQLAMEQEIDTLQAAIDELEPSIDGEHKEKFEQMTYWIGLELGLTHDECLTFVDEVVNPNIDNKLIITKLSHDFEQLQSTIPNIDEKVADAVFSTIKKQHDIDRQSALYIDAEHFFGYDCDIDFKGYFCSYLPTEIAGWEVTKQYLDFVRPALEASNISIDERFLKEHFDSKSISILNTINMEQNIDNSCHSLQEYIQASVGEDCWLHDINIINKYVMPEIMQNGIGADPDILQHVEQTDCFGDYNNAEDVVYTQGNRD